MRLFTQLFNELDATNRTSEKVAALERYFMEAPPQDAAWALYFLSEKKVKRAVSSPLLRSWACEHAECAPWLLEECYDVVGDLAETLALVLPIRNEDGTREPLHKIVEERLVPMPALAENEKRELITKCWNEMTQDQLFVWHKLIMGSFRVGVARTLVVKALAAVGNVAAPTMAHRLMGTWSPTKEDYLRLLSTDVTRPHLTQPYPFCLAYPLSVPPAELGDVREFQAEWKWDGIRAQLIRRENQTLIWSRGEELITDRFPEVAAFGASLPDGTVLDGEIVAWRDEKPESFQLLQQRIMRKTLSTKMLSDIPTSFLAYDILEANGTDIRQMPLSERRILLEHIGSNIAPDLTFRLSMVHQAKDWNELAQIREMSRDNGAEGLMLKRLDSPYGAGRARGQWWKWKIDPYTIDAVLTYAQKGHGKRADLFTDYTFGLWDDGQLVTIAKAYSGLTDAEIARVDKWIRQNTIERFGPVRQIKPELVFELAFEGIQHNPRNKSKLAVRFPRILRWRQDKTVEQADALQTLRDLLRGPAA